MDRDQSGAPVISNFKGWLVSGFVVVERVEVTGAKAVHTLFADEDYGYATTIEFLIGFSCFLVFFDIVFFEWDIFFAEMPGGFFTVATPARGIHDDGFAFGLFGRD